MTQERQLLGLVRRMTRMDRESSARCANCEQELCRNVSPAAAGRLARGHARRYRHRTWARHTQLVFYEPES